MKISASVLSLSALLSLAFGIAPSLGAPQVARLPTKDAPYTDSKSKMDNAIVCPNGLNGAKNGIVLLVPGTALDGKDSYADGPYVHLLPKALDTDACWINLPNRGLSDAQVGGEYVAHAINHLANKSKTGKVKVLGHSQGGGLNIPWALIFFPSARSRVSSFVGLAADFHGTILLPRPVCLVQTVASLGQGCSASFLQQEKGSNMLTAQLKLLTEALVPTTSVFTRTDEIVIPQIGPDTSSRLKGSVQFPLQDICGPLHLADHLSMLVDPAAYAATLDAFTSKSGKTSVAEFDKKQCSNFKNTDLNFNDVGPALKFLTGLGIAVAFSEGAYSKSEPPLKQYVCDSGAATKCGR